MFHVLTTDIVQELGIEDQNGGIKNLNGNRIGTFYGVYIYIYINIYPPCMNHRYGS